jgi:oligopeptide/dipeptide ABC transporter ATP-binding protein
MPLLSIDNLRVQFDTADGVVTAVDGVSLSLAPGETVGLVGESGCGKSVTAMSIVRLVPSPPGRITNGRILFAGEDLLTVPYARLRAVRGAEIGMVFQDPMTSLSPLVRIGDQLVETVRLHRAMPRAAALELAAEWLDKVGVPEARRRLRDYPHQLSGGMQQRVMIASALMLGPRLIIADEPTTALDVTIQAQVLELMRRVKGSDAALLLITHDMGVVWQMCARVAVMYAGELVETAAVADLFARPAHPYTEALLAALPATAPRGTRLAAIPGTVPSPRSFPPGCRFQPRCPYAIAACATTHPDLAPLADARRTARCLRAADLLAKAPLGHAEDLRRRSTPVDARQRPSTPIDVPNASAASPTP